MDPEPGYEDPDGPPPPPPEAVSRSASGWIPPSEPPRDRVGARGPSSAGAQDTDAPSGQGWSTDGPGPAAAADGGTWQVGAPPLAAGPSGGRRRRRWPLVLSSLLLLGLAVTMVVLVLTAEDDGTSVADAGPDGDTPGTAPDPDEDGDGGTDGDEGDGGGTGGEDGGGSGGSGSGGGGPGLDADLDPLDLDALDGLDLVYGRLLTDIDASEREMIGFQADVGAALSGASSRDDGLTAVAAVAAERAEALGEVRARLADPLDDPGAEEVRRLYVDHLDSWADFIGTVAEDPVAIFEQSESGATIAINRTADRFARALEDELPADADAEVARFADGILDRGFRGFGVADV